MLCSLILTPNIHAKLTFGNKIYQTQLHACATFAVKKKKMPLARNVLISLLAVVCLLQFDVEADVSVTPCPIQCQCYSKHTPLGTVLGINCHNRLGIDHQQLYNQTDSIFVSNVNSSLLLLDIRFTPLLHVPRSLCRLTTLTYLIIVYNHLIELPNSCCIGQLMYLDARDNKIANLTNGVFDGMGKLQKLDISNNKIVNLPNGVFDGVRQLIKLDFSGNKITKLSNRVFDGMDQLNILDLSSNKITDLSNGVFNGMSQLTYLNLSDNKITNLPNGLFDGKGQLLELDISDNQIAELPNCIFDNMSHLTHLYIRHNKIAALPIGIFDGMGHLNILDLSGNKMTKLSIGSFDGLHNLFTLILTGNKIAAIDREAFSSKSNVSIQIHHLYLDDNQLISLGPWWHDVNITTKLNIGNNPWNCSCDNKRMTGWLNSIASRIDDLEDVRCYSPSRLQGKTIIQMSNEEFCADPPGEAINRAWTISMSSVVIVLLSVCVIVYLLRVKLYTRLKFHPFDRDECLGEDMDYDVFLCCSSDDDEQVRPILEKLESNYGYRVCYHYRDFRPGTLISENIEAAVKRSKRTLCFLTVNFIRRFANAEYVSNGT